LGVSNDKSAKIYQPLKNASSFFVFPQGQKKQNSEQADSLTTATLDKELAPSYKNLVVNLPSPHEEFDVNYIYQY